MILIIQRHTRTTRLQNQNGFTLVEIIVTLILISITGVVMFPVLRTNLTKSAVPVVRMENQYHLIQEMDRLTARYRDELQNDSLSINDFDINDFKTNYVDVIPFRDAGNTGFLSVGQITGNTYNTQSTNILRVTLVDGDQTLVSFFTE
jgi:prepilin-type N-terminal cleavage/methylation domain-containing protein